MHTLTTDQLKARLDAGPVALFDVRGDVVYEQGHIPGAKTAPLGSLVFRVARVMNPDSVVVVYSDGDGDSSEAGGALATQAAERLENLKLTNVHVYEGGLRGWREAGHQVVASVGAKLITQGPVEDCRPIVVDREQRYGGAFNSEPEDVSGAGG